MCYIFKELSQELNCPGYAKMDSIKNNTQASRTSIFPALYTVQDGGVKNFGSPELLE